MYKFRYAMMVCTIIAPLLMFTSPGSAETAENYRLEEIIVTARKLEESLQSTPISITALTGDALKARNLDSLTELGAYAPNVQMNVGGGGSGGGNNAQIYMRGVGQIDFLFTTDPGVGVYVDGVYHPRSLGTNVDLLDVERVEILRGPQGTLFGKNTIGGAISLISQKPNQDREFEAEITAGSFDRRDFRIAWNTPLTDELAARLSFSSKNRDGYAKVRDFDTREVIDHQGDVDTLAGRLALRWNASDVTQIDFSIDFAKEREQSSPTTLVQFEAMNGLAPLWNGLVGFPSNSPMTTEFISAGRSSFGNGPNRNKLDAWGTALHIQHEFDDISVKSITAYRVNDGSFGRDGDGSPNSYVHTNQDQEGDYWTQELQISGTAMGDRLHWLGGVFYMDENGVDDNDVRLASGLFQALEGLPAAIICLGPGGTPPCAGGAGNPVNAALDLDFDIHNEIDIQSFAVFGYATFDLSDKLSFSLGVRYTEEEKDYTLNHLRVNSGVPIVPLTTVSEKWDEFSPKVSLDYQFNKDVLAYVSISRGFKSGGFNGRPTVASEVESYDPEFVTTYEVGAKAEFADNRVRLNGAFFFNDYEDIQITSVSADDTGNLILVVDNAAKADVYGFELELLASLSEGFSLSAGLGYIHARYKDVGTATEIIKSSRFVKTPKWSGNIGLQYEFAAGINGNIRLRTDLSFTGKVYHDPQNTESIAQGSLALLSAQVVYEQTEQEWEVVLGMTNLTDKKYIVAGLQALASFGTAEATYATPRQFAISFRKWF